MPIPSRTLCFGCIAALGLLATSANSGTLLDYYELAGQNDLTLRDARYQRDAEREARPQALAAILPQVGVQANLLENRFRVLSINQDNNQFDVTREGYRSDQYSLTLNQAVFDWSAFKSLAAAGSTVAQAEAAYRSAEQSLIVRLVNAYLAALSAEDTLRADMDAQAAFQLQYDQQSDRYKAGLGAVTDVSNAQAAYDSSTATVITDTTTLNAAKRALATIVGTMVLSIDALRGEITLVPPSPALIDSWTAAAARDNLEVMTARHAAEAARLQVSAATGRRLPTLSAVGSASRDGSESRFGYDSETEYLGLSLNWDLYRGGQVSSIVRQAEATYAQAQTQYQLRLLTADQNVRDHHEGVVAGIAAVKAAANAVASQRASVVATEVGFKVGTRTIIDTLNTRQNLVAAQKALATARYNYLISLVLLKADVGQLSLADVKDLDGLLTQRVIPVPGTP